MNEWIARQRINNTMTDGWTLLYAVLTLEGQY